MRFHTSISVAGALCGLLAAQPARAQWSLHPVDSTIEFRGLSAVNASVVWASGTRGRIARSTDGGATWRIDTVPGARRLDLRDIQAMSATRAWTMSSGAAEGGQARIFGTTDGATWSEQFAEKDSGGFFDSMAAWDDNHAITIGDPINHTLYVLLTSDGHTWSRGPTDHAPATLPGEGSFAASGTCVVVNGSSHAWIITGGAEKARVFRTTDRGKTWHVGDTPVHAGNSSSGIFSVAFVDATHGVVVGGDYTKPKGLFDNVALTDDGGATWRLPRGPLPQGFMSAVAYIPGTSGKSLVAVGLGGTARSDDGGESWTMIDAVPYNSVAFVSPTVGWAVGPRGRIARWSPASGANRP